MAGIFNLLKTYQISLGDFEKEYEDEREESKKQRNESESIIQHQLSNVNDLAEKLCVDEDLLENLDDEEKTIYTLGIYLLTSLDKFVFDSNAVHIRMTSNRKLVQGMEYKSLSKVDNGILKDAETAFRLISIIYQMVYRNAENIKISYTSSGLVAVIKDPENMDIPIILKLMYKQDKNETLEKASKLQVSKTGGSYSNK